MGYLSKPHCCARCFYLDLALSLECYVVKNHVVVMSIFCVASQGANGQVSLCYWGRGWIFRLTRDGGMGHTWQQSFTQARGVQLGVASISVCSCVSAVLHSIPGCIFPFDPARSILENKCHFTDEGWGKSIKISLVSPIVSQDIERCGTREL
jgi:hypothetical protein